jgi:broad specificity phosphatase PhoE
MSSVLVVPEMLETAAADAAQIGSAVRAAHLTAVIPTIAIQAAGADEVSATITALFGAHAQEYQAAAAQAATHYEQFVRTLGAAAASYAGAEAAIATSMQGALGAMTPPTQLLGSPLLANAANAASTGFQTFVGGPMHTIGQAWVNSPFGRALDPIINASTGALFGRDLIGNGSGTGGQAPAGGGGGSAKSITIDFVRHGQSEANLANIISTAVPGPTLTSLGMFQAQTIANTLFGQGPFAGIFSSQLLRTQLTAAPLATLLGVTNVPQLAGLNEISAGNYEGLPVVSLQSLVYAVGPIAWWLGFPIVPMLAPGAHLNGVTFYQGFNSALQTMYATTVNSSPGNITDAAFSSQFAIEIGTMMTVKNPDPLLMFTNQLPNTGEVVVQGSPQDGWTLVSWDGVSVPQHSLPLELLGTTRDLIMAPQFAAYNIWHSLGTGDPATVISAVQAGVDEVGYETVLFPVAVAEDVVDAVSNLPL